MKRERTTTMMTNVHALTALIQIIHISGDNLPQLSGDFTTIFEPITADLGSSGSDVDVSDGACRARAPSHPPPSLMGTNGRGDGPARAPPSFLTPLWYFCIWKSEALLDTLLDTWVNKPQFGLYSQFHWVVADKKDQPDAVEGCSLSGTEKEKQERNAEYLNSDTGP
ncbi:hypothetical protein DFH07DRAFT_770886 [Mycena maculata]|uniref:Uncharacterized protein n=1 Tax=Mycena maculata TaxID=230809 RepID=A0AAD7JEF6_9AGAR|nr:hypothetical protein DFH07DRAFT_770886 [Mycena maculata]